METHGIELDSGEKTKFRAAVRRWYAKHGRELPWRNERDPYRVWVREIMLQQTTVVAVVPYLERFFAVFPTVQSLAEAETADVLKAWEGLGYYSRAKNLHKTARLIAGERSGQFPDQPTELQSLPGIGRYTAGAIASFAFGKQAPIVEANTNRLYARLIGLADDTTTQAAQRTLWNFADQIVPAKEPGSFNQALMDLGATVCTPNDPDCPACPLKGFCAAFRDGTVAQIPAPKKRAKPTELTEICVAIEHQGRFLTRLRPPGELWAGLWDYPRFTLRDPWPSSQNSSKNWKPEPVLLGLFKNAEADIRELTNTDTKITASHGEIRHSVTRYRIRLLCVSGHRVSGRLRSGTGLKWTTPKEINGLPMTKTAREFSNHLLTQ